VHRWAWGFLLSGAESSCMGVPLYDPIISFANHGDIWQTLSESTVRFENGFSGGDLRLENNSGRCFQASDGSVRVHAPPFSFLQIESCTWLGVRRCPRAPFRFQCSVENAQFIALRSLASSPSHFQGSSSDSGTWIRTRNKRAEARRTTIFSRRRI
jgi:hypothetical protein